MAWFGRKKRPGTMRAANNDDTAHLEAFAASRQGVEAYVEPRTAVTEATVVFVATDGEWTRRRIDGPDAAQKLARRLAIPIYDAAVMGYPERMRDWTARQKQGRAGEG